MELYSSFTVLQVFRRGSDTSTSNRRLLTFTSRSNDFNKTGTPIPFEAERLNVGGAMNRTSGKFTAQRDGIYVFSFTGLPHFLASSSVVKMDVAVYLNGNWIGAGWADEVGTANQYETLSWQSTMNLKNGDEIWLEI